MNIKFLYDKEKDVWCLLNKGKKSNNSQSPTKQYEQLTAKYGEDPTTELASDFIEEYKITNNLNAQQFTKKYQEDWDSVSVEFQKRAETVFGISLPENITAYLTINSRCPYSISNDYFFVAMPTTSSRRTAMHELWHFYTWYGLGTDQEAKIGKEKYNEIKEALTALLNVECKDLLPEGIADFGYPQHQELRQHIVKFWSNDRDIKKLWAHLAQ